MTLRAMCVSVVLASALGVVPSAAAAPPAAPSPPRPAADAAEPGPAPGADPAVRPAPAGESRTAREIVLDGDSLTLTDILHIVRGRPVTLRLDRDAAHRMRNARDGALRALKSGQRVYGWNQALGPLKDRPLTPAQQVEFQRRVLRSHAAGTGRAVSDGEARLALVLRANTMARAKTGVRPEMVRRMLSLVNAGVTPVVPQVGSLGTGDLQPMAAAGLVLTGEKAPARYRGRTAPADETLRRAGLRPSFPLQAGEALPLISGSGLLTARYVHAVDRAASVESQFEGAFALFMEATRAEKSSLDARTHDERRIPDQRAVAARLRALVAGSRWMTEEGRRRLGEDHPRVQDAVSVRAAPHIAATLAQTLREARVTIEREANASTSNPLVFRRKDGTYEFVMGGNWDGAQIGHALDTLNAQVTDVAVLAHELSARLLSNRWSYGLPANLAHPPVGLNSGMVQAQTTAAALIPEMQTRAAPSGVLSRPEKDGQEDHNTMAMASARNLHENLDRSETVLGVLLMMDAQGIDLIRKKMRGLALGTGTEALHRRIRETVRPLRDDRWLTPDVRRMTELVRGRDLQEVVERESDGAGGRVGGTRAVTSGGPSGR